MPAVATVFLRHRGDVLLIRRSPDSETYPDRWAAVSGYVEPGTDDPLEDAHREVREETGKADLAFVRRGEPLSVPDGDHEWTVHPFLFEVPDREVTPNHEFDEWAWRPPTAILDRETVPALWRTYRRVAADVDLIRADGTHGAAWLSVRALEVLRDRAGAVARGVTDGGREAVAETARELRDARPSMVVVRNRVNRVLSAADRTPAAVHDRAVDAIEAASAADREAASRAADRVADAGGPIATISRSGTVADAVREADAAVLIGESRPAREGVDVAAELAGGGHEATLTTDAALPASPSATSPGSVLVGADRVLPGGDAVNKVGTYPLALAAREAGVPVYVAAAADKIAPDAAVVRESGDPADLYDGAAPLRVESPIFERVPGALVDGVVTEAGVLDADAVAERAREHAALAAWDE